MQGLEGSHKKPIVVEGPQYTPSIIHNHAGVNGNRWLTNDLRG